MRFSVRPFWAFVVTLSATAPALAQTAPFDHRPTATAVELNWRSTFEGYQRFTDEKVGSWREANDTVGRNGGWRAYANEARQPSTQATGAPAVAPPAAGATAPATDSRAGHGKP